MGKTYGAPLLSLPVALKLDGIEEISTKQNPNKHQPTALPNKGRIGLVWAAGHKQEADAQSRSEQRSLPAEILVSVLDQKLKNNWRTGEIQLVNLQQDREVPKHPTLQKRLRKAEPLGSWLETSQRLKDLDGLICVDTAIAHLAGLIKLPTVLVLNTPCDWRWGITGCRSRWYPNINIARMKWRPLSENA